jgi:branched-subunit amino acid transport protein
VTGVWISIGLLAAGTVLLKAAGPIVLGGRALPERLSGVVTLLAPCLLAALVLVGTVGGGERSLEIDARVAGVVAAAGAIAARLPLIVVLLVAAVVTAGLRALA